MLFGDKTESKNEIPSLLLFNFSSHQQVNTLCVGNSMR